MKMNYYESPESKIIELQMSDTLLQQTSGGDDGGMEEGGEV